jgi:hypothetical protein
MAAQMVVLMVAQKAFGMAVATDERRAECWAADLVVGSAESSADHWAAYLAVGSAGWMVDRKVESMVEYWAVPMAVLMAVSMVY